MGTIMVGMNCFFGLECLTGSVFLFATLAITIIVKQYCPQWLANSTLQFSGGQDRANSPRQVTFQKMFDRTEFHQHMHKQPDGNSESIRSYSLFVAAFPAFLTSLPPFWKVYTASLSSLSMKKETDGATSPPSSCIFGS